MEKISLFFLFSFFLFFIYSRPNSADVEVLP